MVLSLLFAFAARAQEGPEADGSEMQLWVGGGHSVSGGTARTGVLDTGFRYGWILTNPHGPGFLRGRFEYCVDAVPLYLIFQPGHTVYGGGWNPLGLKWNFVPRGRIVPYFELGGGVLFTNRDVPGGTSKTNFTPSAALGFHHLGGRWDWSLEARYLHISDAGLSDFNPGINTIQIRLGLGGFRTKNKHTR